MKNKFFAIALASSFSLAVFTATAAEKVDTSKLPPASDKKDVTYDKDIKPIFEKACFKCHGEEKQKGKLRLDSLEAALKGGEEGPNVIKGKSAESSLVIAVARLDEDTAMPPEKKDGTVDAVSKENIALIRAWIDQGAK
ncbi:MAG: c-type cytochrome domain-containing protein [Verrucomicrobiota bacterium]